MSANHATTEVAAITDATFEHEVLESDRPVLADFTAAWCPPCRLIAPVLGQIARERSAELVVVELDVDENPGATRDYRVMAMPTLMLFRAGKPLLTVVGARPKNKLLAELDAALAE